MSGTVTKQAVRLRVLFHNGPPMDLVPVDAGDQVAACRMRLGLGHSC